MLTLTIQRDQVGFLERLRWQQTARSWAMQAGPIVTAALREEAPTGQVNGGRLKNSIRYTSIVTAASASMQFHADTPYTGYVIRGTPAHEIRPRRARVLHWNRGEDVYAARVFHPGTEPNPFPRRALVKVTPVLQQTFKYRIQAALEGH